LRAELAAAYIDDGRWTTNTGDGRHAFVSRRDCAAAAAAAVTSEVTDGRIYRITGPELIGAAGFTGLLADVAGAPVECVQIDDTAYEQYRIAFQAEPRNAGYTELFTGTGVAIRTGFLSEQSDDVLALTGRPPLTLGQIIAAQLPGRAG
jgi:NAD(P)H dehydrogenase (quinone)